MLFKRCKCGRGKWPECEHQYFTVFKHRGERIPPQGTGENRKRQAEAKAEEFRVALRRADRERGGASLRTQDRVTLHDLLTQDLANAKARGGRSGDGIAKGTLRGLAYAHDALRSFWGPDITPATAFAYDQLQAYVEHRRTARTVTRTVKTSRKEREQAYKLRAASPATLKREFQVLRRLHQEAAIQGLCAAAIRWPVFGRGRPNEQLRGRVHPQEIVHAYLDALPRNPADEARAAMFSGWREGTLRRLRPEYLEPSPIAEVPAFARIPAQAMKGRKEIYVPLNQPTYDLLKARERDGLLTAEGFYFADVDWRYHQRAALKKIGYGDTITLRDLRTTYVNTTAHDNPLAALHLGNHGDLRTTAIYTRENLESMAKATNVTAAQLAPRGYAEGATQKPDELPAPEIVSDLKGKDGAKKGTRTLDLLITNQLDPIPGTVSSCFYCGQDPAGPPETPIIPGQRGYAGGYALDLAAALVLGGAL
jgi:integrase